MIVDAHVHVWEPPSARYPWQPLGNFTPNFAWTVEEQVQAMERAGIDKAVIVQMSWYGYDNRYVLDCLRRYPGRFAVVGMLDPASATTESDIEQLVTRGVGGFRLAPRLRPDIGWYGSPQADRLWRRAEEFGLVLTLLISPAQLAEAEKAIVRFPGVPVAIDHLARPDAETDPARPLFKQLLGMARHGNIHLKVSALAAISREPYPHADVLDLVRRAFDAYGPQRLMWGTDYAMSRDICSLEMALELIDRALAGVRSEDRAWVLGGTAARLWKWANQGRGLGTKEVNESADVGT